MWNYRKIIIDDIIVGQDINHPLSCRVLSKGWKNHQTIRKYVIRKQSYRKFIESWYPSCTSVRNPEIPSNALSSHIPHPKHISGIRKPLRYCPTPSKYISNAEHFGKKKGESAVYSDETCLHKEEERGGLIKLTKMGLGLKLDICRFTFHTDYKWDHL